MRQQWNGTAKTRKKETEKREKYNSQLNKIDAELSTDL